MFNRIIYLLIIVCCFPSYADEPTWKWVEIDLNSSTLISHGNAKVTRLNASRTFELYNSESNRMYHFLCDFSSSFPSCNDESQNTYEAFYHVSKQELAVIDLNTGIIFGSVQTYVLFQNTKMISISLHYPLK